MKPIPRTAFALLPALALFALIAFILRRDCMDDAYIGLRCLHHFLTGQGFAFNPPDRIEAVTNIGWLLALAPLAPLIGEVAAAKIAGLALAVVVAALAFIIALDQARESGRSAWLYAAPVPILVATQADFALFSQLGMETALLAALILAAAVLVRRGRLVAAALVCAFAFLTHPEAGLIFPLFLAITAATQPERIKDLRAPLLVFAGAIAAVTLVRHFYFSAWLPHTFEAKSTSPGALIKSAYHLLTAANRNAPYPLDNLIGFGLMIYGLAAIPASARAGARLLAAAALAGLILAAYAPADWSNLARYFAPYAPAGLILLWTGLTAAQERLLADRLGPRRLAGLIAAWLVLLAGLGLANTYSQLRPSARGKYPGYVLFARELVAPSRWVRDHTPPDAVIASRRIGALGYYSQRPIFDYKFGLAEPEVVELHRAAGEDFNYPTNPALRELWQRRAPDYVMEDNVIFDAIIHEQSASYDRFEIHGLAYRELKRFRLGPKMEWVLCEKVP
jgi:hypothetical protein